MTTFSAVIQCLTLSNFCDRIGGRYEKIVIFKKLLKIRKK